MRRGLALETDLFEEGSGFGSERQISLRKGLALVGKRELFFRKGLALVGECCLWSGLALGREE